MVLQLLGHDGDLLLQLHRRLLLVRQQFLDCLVPIEGHVLPVGLGRLHCPIELVVEDASLGRLPEFIGEHWVHRLGDSDGRFEIGHVVRVRKLVDVDSLILSAFEEFLVFAFGCPKAAERRHFLPVEVSGLRQPPDLVRRVVDRFTPDSLQLLGTLLSRALVVVH